MLMDSLNVDERQAEEAATSQNVLPAGDNIGEGGGIEPCAQNLILSVEELWEDLDKCFKTRFRAPTDEICYSVSFYRLKAVVPHGQFSQELKKRYPDLGLTTARKHRREAEALLTLLHGKKPDLKELRKDPSPLFGPQFATKALRAKFEEWGCESLSDVRQAASKVTSAHKARRTEQPIKEKILRTLKRLGVLLQEVPAEDRRTTALLLKGGHGARRPISESR